MPAEWECFLAKAVESLASAQLAYARGMHNCAANRAYYAAYLAELAALQKLHPLHLPKEGWMHQTVVTAFNHRLVRTKRIFRASMIRKVSYLESLRIKADYKADHVSKLESNECCGKAHSIVHTITNMLKEK